MPPPVVPPEAYDTAYFLDRSAGHAEWEGGEGAAATYHAALQFAELSPGEVLVDIGTGRGELLGLAVEAGAKRAVGIEYAPAAVALARRSIEAHGAAEKAEVVLADARSIPLEDGVADVVTSLEVVEHLSPAELAAMLAEALRLLKPGGRLLVYTMPNRLIYDVTYRLQRLASPRRRRTWPRDPRGELERSMHVNEQTRGSLRRALRKAGFAEVSVRRGLWVYTDHVPDETARVLYHRLAARRPTGGLGLADLWAHAHKR